VERITNRRAWKTVIDKSFFVLGFESHHHFSLPLMEGVFYEGR